MKVPQEQIELRKKIGKAKGDAVWHLKTKGGLHIVTVGNKIVGSGPHACVARRIAQNYEPEIEFTELSKSDYLAPETYEHLLPRYSELTEEFRKLQGK